ncbi:MAG: tetratricopeptide repeat protein [Planctomycetota bacterium]|nr:tetratricopeptide repeat protein [Planctomycetota bacterium]
MKIFSLVVMAMGALVCMASFAQIDVGTLSRELRDLRREGKAEEVLVRLDEVRAEQATDTRLVGERVQALLDLGRMTEAMELTVEVEPGQQVGLPLAIGQARIFLLQGKTEEGLKQVGQILAIAPNNIDARVAEIRGLVSLQRFSEAATKLSALPEGTPSALRRRVGIDVDLGRAQQEGSDPDGLELAIPRLEAALARDDSRLDVRLELVEALIRFHREEKAEDLVLEVLEEATQEDEWSLRVALASVYRSGLRLEEAEELLEQVLDQDPTHFGARRGLARCALKGGDLEQAEERLRSCHADRPRDIPTLMTLGEVSLARRNGKGAEEAMNKILEMRPHHLKALYVLSRGLRLQGRDEEAGEALKAYEERKRQMGGG